VSINLVFMYVQGLLVEKEPLSEQEIAGILTQFRPDQITVVLAWAVDNGSLRAVSGGYVLTERGRR
jgi:hypothetical protein